MSLYEKGRGRYNGVIYTYKRHGMRIYHEEDIKKCFRNIIIEGEVLKNGAFIINYKKLKELAGKELI